MTSLSGPAEDQPEKGNGECRFHGISSSRLSAAPAISSGVIGRVWKQRSSNMGPGAGVRTPEVALAEPMPSDEDREGAFHTVHPVRVECLGVSERYVN